jgi:hypothetical protein
MTSLAQIHALGDRYPFSEEELEILCRAHDRLMNVHNTDGNFILTLALASPYTTYFVPGDEVRRRVSAIQQTSLLPPATSEALCRVLFSDAFVNLANQGQDAYLEKFVEGIASTGRRGSHPALHMLHALGTALIAVTPESESLSKSANCILIDLAIRLAYAAEVLKMPNLESVQEYVDWHMKGLDSVVQGLVDSLESFAHSKDPVALLESSDDESPSSQSTSMVSGRISTFPCSLHPWPLLCMSCCFIHSMPFPRVVYLRLSCLIGVRNHTLAITKLHPKQNTVTFVPCLLHLGWWELPWRPLSWAVRYVQNSMSS